MTGKDITSIERVMTALGQKEPDRVPFFLLVTMHGAKELGLSIKEYFSRPENVAEGQLRLRAKYRHDSIYGFFYAPVEVEAWGAEVIFRDDCPPNSGTPFISKPADIDHLEVPRVKETACLTKVLKALQILKQSVTDAPIIGVVMSPFSLPVMQMGFDRYFDLIYDQPDLFTKLMRINEEFCVEWANAQLEAGANVICYFDPVSSPTIVPRDLYLKTGFQVARRTLSRIKGPTATHLASGNCSLIIDDLVNTGTLVIGVSAREDISAIKKACAGRLTVLGNLNGIEMRRWTPGEAESIVKQAIARAGRGGGLILSDNHGEIPYQVPDKVLVAISEAVHKWGKYPLDWVKDFEK